MIVLWHKKKRIEKYDEWRATDDAKAHSYTIELEIKFIWDNGFGWVVTVPNFSCAMSSLSDAVFMALEYMHDDSPRYFRLKEELMNKKMWRYL